MARARNIKPGLFRNEVLGISDPLYTLLFEGLWLLSDKQGRLEDRPVRIKADIFPYRDCDIEAQLTWLHNHGFIFRYQVNGSKYIEIINFSKHQNPHCKEPDSTIPPPNINGCVTVQEQFINDSSTADSGYRIPDSLNHSNADRSARFDPMEMKLPGNLQAEKWQEWVEYRKARKLKTVEQTWKKQLTILARSCDPAAVIDKSIMNGWQGLFEINKARSSPISKDDDRRRASELLTGRRDNGERVIDGTSSVVS